MVVFGAKEKNLPMEIAREKEVKRAKEIIAEVAEEGEGMVKQIEDVYRIRKYNEKVEGMREMWIKRDMNEEERSKLKELRVEPQ